MSSGGESGLWESMMVVAALLWLSGAVVVVVGLGVGWGRSRRRGRDRKPHD
ncbi:hypothetical protein [Nocardia wallacei]|uniref:hypothetical protein n=1 Tax=Nocardia wallacei TaxID=480035 RepID=UPI001656A9AE|nr:hypothetical protein [Nocardia wallacei]